MTPSTYEMVRRIVGLSQSEAASFHGVRDDTITAWCRGKRNPPPGVWQSLRDLRSLQETRAAELLTSLERQYGADRSADITWQAPAEAEARRQGYPTVSAALVAVAIVATAWRGVITVSDDA